MTREITIKPLTVREFLPFGDVLSTDGPPDKLINQGLCGRYNDRAKIDILNGRTGISLFDAKPRRLPLTLDMVERHPDGSQTFLPMTEHPFLVIVAPDENGSPGRPLAFRTGPGEGVNFARNTWHGVLTPLHAPGLFAVIDRIGPGDNLEEHWFDEPWLVLGES